MMATQITHFMALNIERLSNSGMPQGQIALQVGCSRKTVMAVLSRGSDYWREGARQARRAEAKKNATPSTECFPHRCRSCGAMIKTVRCLICEGPREEVRRIEPRYNQQALSVNEPSAKERAEIRARAAAIKAENLAKKRNQQ